MGGGETVHDDDVIRELENGRPVCAVFQDESAHVKTVLWVKRADAPSLPGEQTDKPADNIRNAAKNRPQQHKKYLVCVIHFLCGFLLGLVLLLLLKML